MFLLYAAGYSVWGYLSNTEKLSQGAELWSACALFLSPVLVNAFVLVRHEQAFDEPPPHLIPQ